MNLLVFTQKIDRNDTTLGFFHEWVIRFSRTCENVFVICLEKGEYDFPNNVKVFSLGKENRVSRFGYLINLFKHLKDLSNKYDKVFVHMNQEYVLIGGLYWLLKGIPVYLWRNHPEGSLLTRIAVLLSTKVFCTSKASFTALFNKTVIMPAGINTSLYKKDNSLMRKKYSICMVGRISPVKHIELALEAINILVKEGVQVSFSIVGDTPERDMVYSENLKKYVEDNNLSKYINFESGVKSTKLPEVYYSYELCLNLTESGSFDKTIVEATSCGAIPIVSSQSFSGLLPGICITDKNPRNIANTIKILLDATEQLKIQKKLEMFVKDQSLDSLMDKINTEIK